MKGALGFNYSVCLAHTHCYDVLVGVCCTLVILTFQLYVNTVSCLTYAASACYLRERRMQMFLPVFVCLSVCLSVCLLARLLKNTCMDFGEMWRVDRCWDMDELINV